MAAIVAFVGRLLLSLLFIHTGAMKLLYPHLIPQMHPGATILQGNLAVAAGIFEIVAGVAVLLGIMTRLAALLLAGYCLLTALLFHHQISDAMQLVQAEKNIAIAGGLLSLFAVSQMRWSYDSMRLRRKGEAAARDAQVRAHEAELRAARAEGRADAAGIAPAPGHAAPDVPRKRRWF
jgi:putative oxidoreductase